jgi:ribosomal protein S18 acetylase RimI-like enzyme
VTSLIIRAAEVEDIPSIVGVRLTALTEEEIRGFSAPEFAIYSSIEKLQQAWDRKNRLKDGFEVFIAEDEGKIVGFIVFKIQSDYGYIDNIVVAKEEQGKGIGKALVAYVENMVKSKGCYVVKTDTTENADGIPWKAYGFWTRVGYEDTGERLPSKYPFKEIPLIKKLQ